MPLFMIVILGFVSLLLNLIHSCFISALAPINQAIIALILSTAQFTSRLPFSHIFYPTPGALHITCYFILLMLVLSWPFTHRRKQFLFLFLIFINLILFTRVVLNHKPRVKLIQFDVGYGDSALLRLPRGRHILIDTGSKHPNYDNGESVIAPYLRRNGIRRLNAVFLSHAHNDHIGGLDYLINHFSFQEVLQWLYSLSDLISKTQAIVLLYIHPHMLDQKELLFIKSEYKLLPEQNIESISL